ncbi:hypothetical protein [Escherichia coli]|uniref:hypothetical protein n=1 Tax=Escherichia coli TaxID=562 RepID=UPI00111BCF4A|nr:hypothetical protein [Escherichia coli]
MADEARNVITSIYDTMEGSPCGHKTIMNTERIQELKILSALSMVKNDVEKISDHIRKRLFT